MKICSKCKIEKPESEFSKCSRSIDALQVKCKDCAAAYYAENREHDASRKSAHYAANRDKLASRMAAYYASNLDKFAAYRSENSERIAAQKSSYRAANMDNVLARESAYRKANRERIAERQSAYRAANPEKQSAHCRNRISRKRKAEGSHTAADIQTIFEKQQGLCANCQKKLFKSGAKKYHVDHIMPLKLGGSNWPSNLQCLCPTCNLSKGAKHPTDWAKQQGRLL